MSNHLDLAAFEEDAMLGVDLDAFLVVKGFNQAAIVAKIIERKGNKAFGLTSITDVTERRYSDGLVAHASLGVDSLEEASLKNRLECTEPFEVDLHRDLLAVTKGFRFMVFDLEAGRTKEYGGDWMSYLHTIEFSPDGEHILIASTGLDTVLEIELDTGDVAWEWNAWDHGFNFVALTNSYLTRDPAQADLLIASNADADVRLIEDPLELPREGIATHHSPMNLNGAHYGHADEILVTGYHRPELFEIGRDGSRKEYDLGLANPHSFRPHDSGYMVADTGAGRLLLLDSDFEVDTIVDFSGLPADADKKVGFGEWLQTVSPLDGSGLFAAVDALRDGVHIVDVPGRRRRFISNPPQWTIQAVIPAPIAPGEFPGD